MAAENAANLAHIRRAGIEDRLGSSRDNLGELEMQLREVTAQGDSAAQDKQLQLGLLGSSDAVFQRRNRELAIIEGELTKLEQDLNQAKFQLLQIDSTVARLRTDCSGYEVDQKTSVHKHDSLAQDLDGVRQAQVAEALAEPVQQICDAVMQALEATPPDLAADIVDRGVMLTGGGALLGDLDLALREQTGLSISVANESLNCVALGTGKALEYEKQLRHVIDYDS